ncbi:MAG: metal-binding protein [Cyanobacteria bacterium P01_C01_bin.70]
MPSGKTHDRVTVWLTPWIGLATMITTNSWGYTGLTTGGFVFAGLMFGPDLDIRSVQSKRWGWLGWLWRPYRRSLRHRSWWSHGFLAGTVVRLIYLLAWFALCTLLILEISNAGGYSQITWNGLGQTIVQILVDYWRIWLAIAIGIELGAMSHSIADWFVSAWQRELRKAASKQQISPQDDRRPTRKKSR